MSVSREGSDSNERILVWISGSRKGLGRAQEDP